MNAIIRDGQNRRHAKSRLGGAGQPGRGSMGWNPLRLSWRGLGSGEASLARLVPAEPSPAQQANKPTNQAEPCHVRDSIDQVAPSPYNSHPLQHQLTLARLTIDLTDEDSFRCRCSCSAPYLDRHRPTRPPPRQLTT